MGSENHTQSNCSVKKEVRRGCDDAAAAAADDDDDND